MKYLGLALAFATTLSLYGCDSSSNAPTESTTEKTPNTPQAAQLKSGNMLYVIRDVADMQLKTGDYLTQLKQSQDTLQQAISTQDQPQLQQSVTALTTQLKALNTELNGLNLKSQEVESIRQQILQANQKALAMPLFNGQTDLSKLDFKQVEQQLNTIQSDMLQLAALVISSTDSSDSESNSNSAK